jgi:hypothetical protein
MEQLERQERAVQRWLAVQQQLVLGAPLMLLSRVAALHLLELEPQLLQLLQQSAWCPWSEQEGGVVVVVWVVVWAVEEVEEGGVAVVVLLLLAMLQLCAHAY